MCAWLVFNKMHLSGIEPEAFAWKANMLPLHHRCYASTRNRTSISWLTTRDTIHYTIEAVFPAGLEPATLTVLGWCHNQLDQGNIRQLQDSNLCGQRPIDFKSISLTTRTSCLWQRAKLQVVFNSIVKENGLNCKLSLTMLLLGIEPRPSAPQAEAITIML